MTQDQIIEMAIKGHASTREAIRWAMEQQKESSAEVVENYPFLLGLTAKAEISNAIRLKKTFNILQKRPQNCGTGYCSCIECVMK